MVDGGSSGIVDAALDAADAVADVATREIKSAASQAFGQLAGSQKPQSNHPDPTLQQRIQQDKTDSSQKEAALTKELRMIAHQNAQNLGIAQEASQSHPETEEFMLDKSEHESLSSTTHHNTPLVLDQALRKTESGRNTKG